MLEPVDAKDIHVVNNRLPAKPVAVGSVLNTMIHNGGSQQQMNGFVNKLCGADDKVASKSFSKSYETL